MSEQIHNRNGTLQMTAKSTILIVDDLPAMSQLIARLLSGDGYQLEFAYNGAEALEKAEALSPDLILLDVMMPDIDGFTVCRRLRATPRLAEIPVIMVTALDDRASRIKGLEAGADDFISKPFDQAELRARARAITRLNRYRRLLAERARYERLIELSPDGIFIMDRAGQVRLVNPAMLHMLGAGDETQVLNQSAEALLAPSERERGRKAIEAVSDNQAQKRLESWFIRRDGGQFPVEVNVGRFEWDGEKMMQVIVRDITERRQAEESLRQRNQELALRNRASQRFVSSLDLQEVLSTVLEEVSTLFEAVSASVWLVDSATDDLVCERATGPRSEAVQGLRMARDMGLVGWALKTGETVCVADAQTDQRHAGPWDDVTGVVHRSVLCVPFVLQNQALGVLHLFDDVADRFRPTDIGLVEALSVIAAIATGNALLFQAISTQRGQLRALAGRLAEIQEQERQNLARELHDQMGQNLTVINLSLNLVEQMLPPDTPSAANHHLRDCIDLVDQTVQQVRTVMAELRPPVLDDYGLLAALRWYGQQFWQRTGVTVEVEDRGDAQRCPLAVETALFRIAQEALNNVAKHANANKVTMTMQYEDGPIRLVIADDGRGFDSTVAQQASTEPHWGFLTMQERALAVGGVLRVISQPGAGTTVVVEVEQ